MAECKYVTKKIVKEAKIEIVKVLKQVNEDIKEKYKGNVNFHIVGSAKRNLIVRNGNSPWDIDFQIILDDKIFNDIEAEEIKIDIWNYFKNRLDDKNYKVNFSKSVISVTLRETNEYGLSSFDIAILKRNPKNNKLEILRGKVGDKNSEYFFKWEIIGGAENSYFFRKKEIKNEDWIKFRELFLLKKENDFKEKENGREGKKTFIL